METLGLLFRIREIYKYYYERKEDIRWDERKKAYDSDPAGVKDPVCTS